MHALLNIIWGGVLLVLSSITVAQPQRADIKPQPQAMNNQRLAELIKRIDSEATGESGYWKFMIQGQRVHVITDEKADRMRIIAPIAKTDNVDKKLLYRLMQANFDSALDARYSIAKDLIWSAYIHPLSPLTDEEFLIGIGQVVNLVATYGTSFSSGALIFQGGDSESLQRRKLIDELLEKGLEV